jgi:Beta/Gamma crystallin
MVAFEDGGSEWQCVQYCPRSGPPPAQTVALVAPPPAPPNARCELAIFAEPGLAGPSAPTGEDQPRLGEAGWRNQIASIDVLAGTWDFFTDEEFAGENMRLPPRSLSATCAGLDQAHRLVHVRAAQLTRANIFGCADRPAAGAAAGMIGFRSGSGVQRA